jgi:hypothetical protein
MFRKRWWRPVCTIGEVRGCYSAIKRGGSEEGRLDHIATATLENMRYRDAGLELSNVPNENVFLAEANLKAH